MEICYQIVHVAHWLENVQISIKRLDVHDVNAKYAQILWDSLKLERDKIKYQQECYP